MRKQKSAKSLIKMADKQIDKLQQNSLEMSTLLNEIIKRKQEERLDSSVLKELNIEMEKVDDLVDKILRSFD